ncbi:btk-binding protein-related [Anaeramoeba flamelloides]|uniref:Btk-binding protein-related n=1 Tax=Anaeramoeba flamelloides TaxID=1746091 RepID=A0AAV7ZIA9_9EUKA|nr:btk-binding protein-related [Anaeramoeba flamelloides]
MTNSSSVYLYGRIECFGFVTKEEKNNNLPKWTESNLKKTQTIKKIVSRADHVFLFGKSQTKWRKVWSLADSNRYKVVPLLDADQSTFEEIRYVTFFEEKKLFVNSVVMGYASGYYLCNGDQLYASGSNSHGNLGIGKNSFEEPMPVYVQDKVIQIFAGFFAVNFFFTTSKPDLLYACGNTTSEKLGVGSMFDQYTPTAVKNFKGSEILAVSSCRFHSVLITKKGQTLSCGNEKHNGRGVRKSFFTLIQQLKEKKVVQLKTGVIQTLVLTDQNELYTWGTQKRLHPTYESNKNNRKLPTKIKLPSFFKNYLDSKDMIRIASGTFGIFLYLDFKNTLSEDLRILYKSKKFCDCEIGTLGSQIPVHKALVECRTKLTIDQIQNKLFGEEKSINKEQTLNFLKWVYYDQISEIEKLEQTFNLLELTFPPSVDNTIEKDIAQLYKDDDSKDFKILVKIDDDNQDEDNDNEEDEEEEGNYEEIPVHKFILLARSGLFRAMFDYVNEKDITNKVQDYTRKSIKSLEILIKYFYTNSIELTANEDPELIVDELSDAVEYYQLNDQCNFDSELLKIKKQFDLK